MHRFVLELDISFEFFQAIRKSSTILEHRLVNPVSKVLCTEPKSRDEFSILILSHLHRVPDRKLSPRKLIVNVKFILENLNMCNIIIIGGEIDGGDKLELIVKQLF